MAKNCCVSNSFLLKLRDFWERIHKFRVNCLRDATDVGSAHSLLTRYFSPAWSISFSLILLGSPQIFTLLQVGKFLRENWAVKLLWAVQFNVQLVKVSWALFPTSFSKSWPLCRLCAFFRIIKTSVFIWTHFAPILSLLKYLKCVRMKCSNNQMEQKRLSGAIIKSLCWTTSRVILRKFHFMYFLRHLPIKCGNQILKSAWFYLPTTLPITINKNTGSTYRITQS